MSKGIPIRDGGDLDVIIIGGGPAGLAAAVWCSDLKLSTVLFDEGPAFGGQLNWIYNEIQNYPGIESIEAGELRKRFAEQAAKGSTVLHARSKVDRADLAAKSIVLADGRRFAAGAIIIATGVRRRSLGLPGETELLGRGILRSGAGSRNDVAGQRVVVIGGGDAALENAMILSEKAARVTVVHRSEKFRARPEFIDAVRNKENISFRLSASVSSIRGDLRFEGVDLVRDKSNSELRIDADLMLIRIGTLPNTDLFAEQVQMDAAGFIQVAADMSTNRDGVYAIGDVAYPAAPTLSTAVGTASIATKLISQQSHSKHKR